MPQIKTNTYESISAFVGFSNFVKKFLAAQKPQHICFAFDESLGTCFRNKIFEDYKANRPSAPDELKIQFSLCRELLDILGIIPGYGIAADTINFLLYFVRGEYGDALFSLICLIPTVGSLLGLTGKYIAKYFENSPPEYREYYKSMVSLKDRAKEFQMIENKNLDLDNIAYQDSDQEYSP